MPIRLMGSNFRFSAIKAQFLTERLSVRTRDHAF